jgi:hypothetical protein
MNMYAWTALIYFVIGMLLGLWVVLYGTAMSRGNPSWTSIAAIFTMILFFWPIAAVSYSCGR